MMGLVRTAALGLGLGCALPAGAATVDYTSFHVLGDSLSDVGNLWRWSGRREPPSPPYYEGRFSNGPVWSDRVRDAFRDADLPTGIHAWGNAKALGDFFDVPDLSRQASRYRMIDDDRRGDRPLIAIFIGGNDLLDAAGDSGIRGVGRRAAEEVGDVADGLGRTGARDFLFFTLPDLGAIPRYSSDPDDARSARRGSIAFNRELDNQVAALRDDGKRVEVVDTFALFEALIDDPKAFGVRNTTTPCLDEDRNLCTPRQARRRAFFDEVHPNRIVHRHIAEAAMARIDGAGPTVAATVPAPAAVPLPPAVALLVTALLGLVGLRATSAGPAARGRRRAG